MSIEMQRYSTQPNGQGGYDVILFNELTKKWQVMKGEHYLNEELAHMRANELNDVYRKEQKTLQKKLSGKKL